MQVIKRNGNMEEFDFAKIEHAVRMAYLDITAEPGAEVFAEEVREAVIESIKDREEISVEEIQDIVEEQIMLKDLKIAKSYILYRNEKNKRRSYKKKYKLLSDEFLSRYKHKTPPLNALGNFVFYRTYSRFLPEEGRREYWYETLARAVDYNCSLSKNTTREEAEELYDNLFNLKQQLSGRTLYTGNTKASILYPLSNFNCSFLVIDSIDSFADLFYVLMVGTGAGTTVQMKYSELLPPFRTDINMYHEEWEFTPKEFREEVTTSEVNGDTIKIIIGDSKEGFMEALRLYMNILTNNSYRTIKNIIINYNYIRPKGERLVTFGGTASGHGSMKNMLHKINKIITSRKNKGEKIKLERIDIVDIANIIGENVVSGGVRRTAELILVDSDDEKSKLAKANLYQPDENGEWKLNEAISHRSVSNNSVIYESKPTREVLHEHIKMMRYSGEPGMINAEAARKRRPNFKGVNPCFTGDMKLLTEDGYKTFESLEDQIVRIVNKDGKVTEGKVWSSGVKNIYEIKFADGKRITSTDNHVFMANNGEEAEAKDLKGKRLMPYLNVQADFDTEFVKLGFLQGDGSLSRLSSPTHKGLEINIGKKDEEIRNLFGLKGTDRTEYINGYNERMKELGFSGEILPERIFPSTIDSWSDTEVRSFLRGLYSANGSVVNSGRIAFKTTNRDMAEQLKAILSTRFNITAYITVNKRKKVQFSNGEYECRESYDVNVQRYESRKTFYSLIGFVHQYKTEKLKNLLITQSPMVINVVNTGRAEKVYDFHEPELHWGVVEGVIAHNCGEILLDANSVCNLTTNNVAAFVENGVINIAKLLRAIYLSVRAGYRMTLLNLELPHWDRTHKRDRLLGVSMTGYQDAVTSVGMSIEDQKKMLEEIRLTAHNAMKEIAKEEGLGESLLVTTVKPEGCWTKEFTRVTDRGILFISEIEKSVDDGQGFHGVTRNVTVRGNKVSKVYKNDIKDILKITLKNGRKLRVTPSHPMSVNGKWVEARNLNISDQLDYELGTYRNTIEAELKGMDKKAMSEYRSDVRDYVLPERMSEGLAWLLGAYYANGSFTTNDRIKFHMQHLEIHKKVQKLWKELFNVETTIVKSTDRDSYTQDFRSTKIRKWMKLNGIEKKNAEGEMFIPEIVRASSRNSVLSFIVGYADNDGCFAADSFSIDTAKEQFARHMQEVGEAVGLSLGLSINKARDNSYSKKLMYKMHLSRSFSLPEAIDYINRHSIKAKMSGFIKEGIIRSKNPYVIEKIELEKEQQTYDIEVDNEHWYYQGGLKSHNTLSQVMGGVSAGLHFSHAEYFIRRIRISANDALVKVCEELGWSIHNEVGQTDEDCDTKVIDFPIHSPAKKFKKDVTAIEQLEIYKMFQTYYTDHNTSNTVHVRDDEWDDVEEWLWNNWDEFIGVSFLSESDSFYQLMPYEAIDKETYEKMMASMKEFNPSMLKKYETTGESELDAETCASGGCAVR